MSDFTALIVVSFLGVLGFLVVFYTSKMTNDVGDQIVLGFIGDRPIPIQQRWLMLYNTWVSYAIGGVMLGVFLALAQLQIASHVEDAGVKGLAYLASFLAGFAAIMWLFQGFSTFFNYRSVLRQTGST